MSKLKMDTGAAVTSLDLSKDGAKVVSGGADKTIRVWTLADGKQSTTIPTPAEVRGVGFNADGSRFVVAGADNRARVYGLDGRMQEFYAHDGPVAAAAFQPDGKHVVTASEDKTAKLWATTLAWQAAPTGAVRQALFTPKGDRVVSCGDDKTVRLWNAADGKSVKSITAHDGPVLGVGVSADGTKIASVGADKALKVWTLAAAPGGKDDDKPLAIPLAAPASAVAVCRRRQARGRGRHRRDLDAAPRVRRGQRQGVDCRWANIRGRCGRWRSSRTIALWFRRRPTRPFACPT